MKKYTKQCSNSIVKIGKRKLKTVKLLKKKPISDAGCMKT